MKLLNKLKEFKSNKRGITALAIGVVITLVVLTFMIPIGIYLTYSMQTVVNGLGMTANSAADNASDQVFTTAWQAYNLASIMLIVAAAGAIITIIISAFAVYQSRRG